MRQAEVQSRFLQQFAALYPQFRFRGVRRFSYRSLEPYAFALRVAVGKAAIELDLLCVILTEGHPEEVQRFLRQVAETERPSFGQETVPVFVAPYLSPESLGLCRAAGVGYLDLAGNGGIDAAAVFVHLDGGPNPVVRKREVRSPYEGRSERVVRRLLLAPPQKWTMRSLAVAADTSLGLTSMVTTALAEEGVLTKERTGVTLVKPGEMLDAWAQQYDLRRSVMRIYRAWDDVTGVERRLMGHRAELEGRYALTLWSGAGPLLGDEPQPAHVALYVRGPVEPVVRALNLSPDVGRTLVFIFQAYDEALLWGSGSTLAGLMVASPLQLYLDLGSGDDRELALAQRVRSRLLPW